MPMIVANNLNALLTQNSLNSNNSRMSLSLEHLSTGYKINNGKDAPSGLVISEQLRAQNIGLTRAIQNTQEANNVLGIAEGALNEMNSILKKMRQLAVHSANNGVTSPEQIAADQSEVDSSIQTLDRIARTTKFSDQFLLNGNKELHYDTTLQVSNSRDMNLIDTNLSDIRQIFKKDDFKLNINFSGGSLTDGASGTQAEKAYLEASHDENQATQYNTTTSSLTRDQSFTLSGNKGSRYFSFAEGSHLGEVVTSINSVSASTGVEARLTFDSDVDSTMGALGATAGSAHLSGGMDFFVRDADGNIANNGGLEALSIGTGGTFATSTETTIPAGGGSGTISIGGLDFTADEDGYYEIDSAEKLSALANSAGAAGAWTNSYALKSDIDMSNISNMTTIGTAVTSFTGNLNGNGHTISNLSITQSTDYCGLFGYTENNTIANINLADANISGRDNTGTLVGFSDNTTYSNCHAYSSVCNGRDETGGLIGSAEGVSTITNCSADTSTSSSNSCVGGLVGGNQADIQNSFATGNVSGVRLAGGLVGSSASSTISNSYSLGNATATISTAGGIAAEGKNLTIDNCYASGNISSTAAGTNGVGGIIGVAYSNISIQNNKVLSDTITSTSGSNIGRVYGYDDSGGSLNINDNYANKDMTVTDNNGTKALTKGLDEQDGADTGVQNPGFNTDGYGRIYIKMIDNDNFNIYKDNSMTMQIGEGKFDSSGTAELRSINNADSPALTLQRSTGQMQAGYSAVIQLDYLQEDTNTDQGIDFGIFETNMDALSSDGNQVFLNHGSFLSGLELGKNTSDVGKLFSKITSENNGTQTTVYLYKDERMRNEDLVAQSATHDLTADEYMSVRLFGTETGSTGDAHLYGTINLGYVDANGSFTSEIDTTHHAMRLSAEEYGSDQFLKIAAHEGALFTRYSEVSGSELLDAGLTGVEFTEYGQDATISLNGQSLTLDGIHGSITNLDSNADIVFNQGYIGCSTIAATGYNLGAFATRAGQFSTYTDDVVNALHSTTETIDNFTGGMQFQLGEGAGDQDRIVLSVKDMTATALGKTKFHDSFETPLDSDKTLSINDMLSGGWASLSTDPIKSLEIIDQAIEDVSELRANLGAFQANMLETNASSLSVAVENITKTESYIRDADMAKESTQFSKNQIMVQAGTSMLAQANQLNQSALSLIG